MSENRVEGSSAGTGFRVVQRTIVQTDQELDVRLLYMGGVSGLATSDETTRESGRGTFEERADMPKAESRGAGRTEVSPGMSGWRYTDTGMVTVMPDQRVTFATYFNAFPASYWRRWTDFEAVTLKVRVKGEGTVIVYRSTSRGQALRVDSTTIDSAETVELEFELTLAPFIDGGWYWFDIEAGHGEIEFEGATWGVQTDRLEQGRVSLGITTFNRPDFCVDQLLNLHSRPDIVDMIDRVYVVDQGTQLVEEDPRFAEVAAALGDKLQLIRQGNLGGSGGFSRAMYETLERGESDYVLLLDDDVVCELEGILRAVTFADLTKKPMLVGGHMFNLYARSMMHVWGETMAKYRWFWGPAPGTTHGQDFARRSLRGTPWLHRRVDVDYNGWWMCLIPTQVIREIGLSMPMFIKWDDAEFGLRAQSRGYRTVSLPGVAVWHVPWTEKDDTIDWQAYFHERNRLTSALMHSPYDRGGKLVRESLEACTKHLVSMQYSAAELLLMGLEDVLDGPDRMHRDMANRLAEVREVRKQYPDATGAKTLDSFPAPRRKKPPRKGRDVVKPTGPVGRVRAVLTGMVKQTLPVGDFSRRHPQTLVPHVEQKWWRLMQYDSALVSTADGTSASWYQRDPQLVREQLKRAAALHARLYKEWPELSERYRAALGDLTSPEAWAVTFKASLEDK